MKMELAQLGLGGPLTLKLSHRNEEQLWDVNLYAPRTADKAEALDSNRLFEEINAYWATLPAERQEAIWQTYMQIRTVLDNNYDIAAIHGKLQKLVKQLYDLMPLAEIRHWRAFYSNIRIPTTIKETYGPDDPPERTYLKSDYVELVALAVALRPMVPIWGEYINSTRREIGNVFKEMMALGLLYHSAIQNPNPNDISPNPMERLRVFVEAVVKHTLEKGPSPTAVLGGLGSTELPEWVLALTVVRRLAVGEISASVEDNSHIVTNVFNYIANTLKSMDRKLGGKFGGKVNEKNPPSNSAEEANASIVEMYKVKQEVSDGDLMTLNIYTEQVQTMAQKVWPGLDPMKLEACLHNVKALENLAIHPHQTTLAQWIMKPVLPPRGIELLTKPALLRTLSVTQAVLWEWGFFDLAVLATATPLPTNKGEMIAALESRTRIPKDLMDKLQAQYPFYQQPRGKQSTVRQTNVAAIAIDAYCDMVTRSDWQLHAPMELIQKSSRIPNSKKLIVPSDIRAQLGRLIDTINNPQNVSSV